MYLVIENRHFLGANWLSINWNMVEKKCETNFKLDILLAYHALQENYLFSPTSSSSFSALSFFTRNTLAISSVFVVLYLYFNFFVSCESLDSENKRANNNYYWKQHIKTKEKKWCLCAVWSKDSHQMVATVLIWCSPNFIGKEFYLHNISPFFPFTCNGFIQTKEASDKADKWPPCKSIR